MFRQNTRFFELKLEDNPIYDMGRAVLHTSENIKLPPLANAPKTKRPKHKKCPFSTRICP